MRNKEDTYFPSPPPAPGLTGHGRKHGHQVLEQEGEGSQRRVWKGDSEKGLKGRETLLFKL